MSKYITPHLTVDEFKCPCCGALPPTLWDKDGRLNPPYAHFLEKWEETRMSWDRPIIISRGGGYRCPRYQAFLFMEGKTSVVMSVHCFGLALDNDMGTKKETKDFCKCAKNIYPDFRFGYQKYLDADMTFVHLDQGWQIEPPYSIYLVRGYQW